MTRYAVMVFVAGLLLAAGPAPKEDEAKKDVELLQGTWRLVCLEHDGKDISSDEVKKTTLGFEKQVATCRSGDAIAWKGTFKLDPYQKPRSIDITITGGAINEDAIGKEMHGIYDAGKDELKWCTADVGENDRPKEFATKRRTTYLLYTLKRHKP